MPTSNPPRLLQLCAPVGGWATIEAAAEGDRPPLRRFGMIAYTGGPMILAGWPHPVVVDLAGLRVTAKSRPILKDHNRSLIVGHTDAISIQDNSLLVSGVISGAGAVAREIIESSHNGFPWQASLGALAERVEFVPKGRTVSANGREFEGPVHVVRRATLGEISFVALGADDNTSAQVTASAVGTGTKETIMDFRQWVEAKGFVFDELSDAQKASLQAMYDAEQKPADEPDPPEPPDNPPGNVVATLRAEAAAETQRIGDIRRICAGKHAEIEAKAITEGWDATKTELEVLRAERPAVTGIRRGGDGLNAGAIEAAMCLSAGLPERQVAGWYDERSMNAALSRDLRGAGLHTLLYEVIRAAGDHVRPGRVDNEMIRAAFAADQRLIQAASGFSTISLTGILSNVANKAMLAAYQAVESTVGFFCAETDVNDFKEVTRYRLTGNGIFEKVGPDGELKHTTLIEESYKNRIDTFGRMIALTRQMMINDDLGAFLQIPRLIGRMSALKREEAVYELLLSNPGNFFSTTNKNFLSGADTNLSIGSLTLAEQKFLDQTDIDGRPILLSPAVLLVPTALKVLAQQLMTETRVNETTTAGKPSPMDNPHAGKWKPVASPYLNALNLTGGSAKAWYLFANPADVAAIEIAYLRGKRTPTIESGETSFNTLGMQWRGYFDFGVAMQDFRAAVKVKGEA
ncbi:MAG TPA: hypothetical protein PLL20_01135 [Phycisphaerae bacterium]|nr:hypothetical protein [Phycisphaerae bacterium]